MSNSPLWPLTWILYERHIIVSITLYEGSDEIQDEMYCSSKRNVIYTERKDKRIQKRERKTNWFLVACQRVNICLRWPSW